MNILFRGDFAGAKEYGHMARAYLKALLQTNKNIFLEEFDVDSIKISLDDTWKEVIESRKQEETRIQVKIWTERPNTYSPSPAMHNIALLHWPVSTIPNFNTDNPRDNWVLQLNKMDLVWVPSEFTKTVLLNSGVVTPIEVIPYPLDLNVFRTGPSSEIYDSMKNPLHSGWFKFLSVMAYNKQSDPSSLLLAYLSEFKREEETALVLKIQARDSAGINAVRNFIAKFRKELRLQREPPRIFLVSGGVSNKDYPKLIQACDCTVTTSKGEGIAKPQLESLACGVPVIAPKGSAFAEFITEENGYLVDCFEEPAYGRDSKWIYATQNWHKIDIMDLRRRMREAYDYKHILADKSAGALGSVRSFSMESAAKKLQDSLESLLAS